MYEEVKVANSFQEDAKIHNSFYTLVARVTKLEDAPKLTEKRNQNASAIVKKKTRQANRDHKTLLYEDKVHAKTLKALEDEVFDLRWALCDSLQRIIQTMLGLLTRLWSNPGGFVQIP